MRRFSTFMLLATILFGACSEGILEQDVPQVGVISLPDLTATFADEESSRTYVEDNQFLRWHEADLITAFYGNTLNRQYKFKGKTGDNSGTFSLVPSGELGTGNELEAIYAIYPYDADATITDAGVISLTLPAEQLYAEDSFGKGANTMVAVTESVEDTFLPFKNACGYLKLNLYGDATLASIEIKGNNEEKIAGAATATMSFGGVPSLEMGADATTSVTINCGQEGVALGTTADSATVFWVVLPETTFEEGITITVTDTEGGVFERSTTNEVVIERNTIQPMAALMVEFAEPKPANNEIWYTSSDGAEVTPYATDVFGANIVSNTYDAGKECWVIKFDGNVTSIGDRAFKNCSSLTSVTIGDSVTSIGFEAFYSCSSLTRITIPNSVTSIESYTFYNCSSLESITIPDRVQSIGDYVFYGCSSLESITIPDSVTLIANKAFAYCSSLKEVYCKPTTPPTGGIGMFDDNASGRKIYVPTASVSAYEAAWDWRDYADYIVGYNFETGEVAPEADPKPANNEIWYTATKNCEPRAESYDATIASWAWDSETGKGIVTFDGTVTQIAADAFIDHGYLTSVTLPESVTSITGNAFYQQGRLEAFYGKFASADNRCLIVEGVLNSFAPSGLTSYIIPDGVTSIGGAAFSGCSSLTSVTIPDSVTSIEISTFSGCSSLESVTIPDSVTSIGSWAFEYCSSLTSVYCNAVTPPNLGISTFYNNATNRTIYVYEECVDAYKNAWSGYAGYIVSNGLHIDSSVTTTITYTTSDGNVIDASKFAKKSNTYSDGQGTLVIYGELAGIPDCAFLNCTTLTSITIPDGVTSIGDEAFSGCSSLTSVTIPDSVTSIEISTFSGCSRLESITIPDSVQSIGRSAFSNCRSLTSVTIPDKVQSIGDSAFSGCMFLRSVTIGNSVTSIKGRAFYDCPNLKEVYCKPTTPPTGGFEMFYYYYSGSKPIGCYIYVPTASVDAYKAKEYWSDYASYIFGYDF